MSAARDLLPAHGPDAYGVDDDTRDDSALLREAVAVPLSTGEADRFPLLRSAEELVLSQQPKLLDSLNANAAAPLPAGEVPLPEALRLQMVELATDAHREEMAAFDLELWRDARESAKDEAGKWATPMQLDERTERLLEGLNNSREVRLRRLALEERGKALERAWRLTVIDKRFAEARGRARRIYRHNFRRADGLVEALRRTPHYTVEMHDGRKVAQLLQLKGGWYGFVPATRMDRRLTAALRDRFGADKFYDPTYDAMTIAKFVHEFEAAARAASTRQVRAAFEHQQGAGPALGGRVNSRELVRSARKDDARSLALSAPDAESEIEASTDASGYTDDAKRRRDVDDWSAAVTASDRGETLPLF